MTKPTISLGERLEIARLGYGTLKLAGPGSWGPPPDRSAAIALLRRLPELGIEFVDTADAYGPFVCEELIREALHPYREVTVATKSGIVRTGPFFHDRPTPTAHPLGRPEYLRFSCEMSLRRLDVEAIELWQLHRIDPLGP